MYHAVFMLITISFLILGFTNIIWSLVENVVTEGSTTESTQITKFLVKIYNMVMPNAHLDQNDTGTGVILTAFAMFIGTLLGIFWPILLFLAPLGLALWYKNKDK